MKSYKLKILFSISYIFCGFSAYPQVDSSLIKTSKAETQSVKNLMTQDYLANTMSGNTYQRSLMAFDDRYEGVRNSYYMTPNWQKAELYNKDGHFLSNNAKVKFDAVNKELVMLKTNNDTVAIYPERFKVFDDNTGTVYVFFRFQNNPQSEIQIPPNYVQLLYDGKIKLIKNVSKKLVPASYKGAYSENRAYDSFEDNSTYFIVDENQIVKKITLKKRAIISIFKSKEAKIKIFIKEHKFTLTTENEIVATLKFYEEQP